jgi:hypothetical protein
MEFLTAVSSVVLALPPRETLATESVTWWAVIQSTPTMSPEVVPEPSLPSTRTATTFAFLATP